MRVNILGERDDAELEIEVDGCGRIEAVYKVRESGDLKFTRRRLTKAELQEVARLAGFDTEDEDE